MVIADWSLRVRKILNEAGMIVLTGTSYVDDIRIIMKLIPPGWEIDEKTGRLHFNKELVARHEEEDQVDKDARFKALLIRLFEGINRDLKFTLEMPEDFQDSWLPTLDVSLRLKDGGLWFQKTVSRGDQPSAGI